MATDLKPFGHAPGELRPHQGEVIYQQQFDQCDVAYDKPLQSGARAWLAQASLYDDQPVRTGQEHWLHWSQCMWSKSTDAGCARAYSISDPYKYYDVCRFFPEGNIVGEKPF